MILIVRVRAVAHVWQAYREEMRSESTNGVLHHVSGKLRTSGSEGEDTYHAIDIVNPVRDLHAEEDHLPAIVGPVQVFR